jgi:hypothetical protein
MGGGGFARGPSGGGSFARGAPAGGNFAMRSGPTGNRAFVQGGRTWSGMRHGRHHFRNRSGVAFGFAGPYFYDDSCYRFVLVRGVWRRVWVCY